jgi:hypothetical protein
MFKKLRWFFFYRKTIHKNKQLLLRNHGIRIDWVNRMYKTYTLTDDDIQEIKSFGVKYLDTLLEKDRAKIEETLLSLKIHQFVGLMEVEPLNERQIGIAFRFKYFDTAKIANISIWSLLATLSVIMSYLISPGYSAPIIGLITVFILYLVSRLFVINRVVR